MKSPKKACPYDENYLIKFDTKTFPIRIGGFVTSGNGKLGRRCQRVV
jgi:hypothetical protein